MQEKKVFTFDEVWTQGMEQWTEVGRHFAFQPECIREVMQKIPTQAGVFIDRQYVRFPFERNIVVHDEHNIWMGRSVEASMGGFGIAIAVGRNREKFSKARSASQSQATFIPGYKLLLHFSSGIGGSAFNAIGEVVSRGNYGLSGATEHLSDSDFKNEIGYGIKLVQIDSRLDAEVREYIQSLSEEFAQKGA
jgi:hypothetical protein